MQTNPMGPRITPQHASRARRFGLHFPVYFRLPNSPTWLGGVTENISYTGLLFRSVFPMTVRTPVELRLPLAAGRGKKPAELVCKGAVVRVEEKSFEDATNALAVAIQDYRIVRPGAENSPATNAVC